MKIFLPISIFIFRSYFYLEYSQENTKVQNYFEEEGVEVQNLLVSEEQKENQIFKIHYVLYASEYNTVFHIILAYFNMLFA